MRIIKFGDIAQNIAVRVDPAEAKTDVYVGLEHLDPESLHLKQWGHPSDVTGQKLVFQKGDVIFGHLAQTRGSLFFVWNGRLRASRRTFA